MAADTSSTVASSLQVFIDKYTIVSATTCDIESTINANEGRTWVSSGSNSELNLVYSRLGTKNPLSGITLTTTGPVFRIEEMVDLDMAIEPTASPVRLDETSGMPLSTDTITVSKQENTLSDGLSGGMTFTGTASGNVTGGTATISSVLVVNYPVPVNSSGSVNVYIPVIGTFLAPLDGTLRGIMAGTISATGAFSMTSVDNITVEDLTWTGAFTNLMLNSLNPTSSIRLTFDTEGTYLATTLKARLVFPTPLYSPLLFGNLDTETGSTDVIIRTPEFGANGIASSTGGTMGGLVCEILGLHRVSSRTIRCDLCIRTSETGGFRLATKDVATPLLYLMPSPGSVTGSVTSLKFLKGCYVDFSNANPIDRDDNNDDVTQASSLHNSDYTTSGATLALADSGSTLTTLQTDISSTHATVNFTNSSNSPTFRVLRFICEISWTNATSSRVLLTASLNKTTIAECTIVK